MNRANTLGLLAAGALIWGAAHAAPTSAISLGAESNFLTHTFTVGWAFSTSTAIRVTDLGYFDRGSDGLVSSHAVGLWTLAGALLTSGIVTPADALDGQFRYTDVADVVIGPGFYVVGGLNDSADGFVAVDAFLTAPEITWLEGRFVGGGALAFPVLSGITGEGSVFGGSFRFDSVIPEPGVLTLLLAGLAGVVASRRRR